LDTLSLIGIVFFAAFAGGIPPGLVNMAVAKTVLEKNKRNGYYSAAGVCTVNFLHALVSVILGKYIVKHATIQTNILKLGVLIFAVLAIYFLWVAKKNKPHVTRRVKFSSKDSRKSFGKGFFIANLNILPIPYFVLISTQLADTVGGDYDVLHILLFSLSAAAGTFSILHLYIQAFLRLGKKTEVLATYANYFMSALMFLLFLITLLRVYYAG